jgi:glycerate dehydrogenase
LTKSGMPRIHEDRRLPFEQLTEVMKMKIVVLDGYTLNPGDISWDAMRKLGNLTVYDRTSYDRKGEALIVERAGDAEAIFTNKTPLSKDVISRMPKLKFIGVLATGYNVVDVKAAKERGVIVTNVPAYGTASTAQMAISLLLELCQNVGMHSESVHKGEWTKNVDWCYWKHPLIELSSKNMGIIGYGRIGQATGRIAQALGMTVLANSRFQNKTLESATMKYVELDTLFSESDVISLHCPLADATEGIINKESIAMMKDGILIINNSRGPLIVEQDLADALNSGKVAGAAVDVVSVEPIRADNPLLRAKNCIITPHISWAPIESRRRLIDIAVENLERFIAGDPVNIVS